MTELLNLGKLAISDFIKEGDAPRGGEYELKLVTGEYGEAMIDVPPPDNAMYGKYWYRSSVNATMKKQLRNIVDSVTDIFPLKDGDVWLDIASNDGTLLSYVPSDMYRIGIDPADDSFKKEAETKADLIIQDYFSYKAYRSKTVLKAKVITSIAVFYDIKDRKSFLTDINDVLDDDGLWVIQMSYTPLMIEQLAFDNICHEHAYYYSLSSIYDLLGDYGLQIMDCQLNDVNGGSFRLYVMKDKANTSLFGTQPYRDVCNFRIKSLFYLENNSDISDVFVWNTFKDDIDILKEQVVFFIKSVTAKGKVVMGYGASTKGNTLLQYFGLEDGLITAIADRNPQKWGLKTVKTNIPIISEEEMRNRQPDYLLILPWHFIKEFQERESEYIWKGGKFIVPCPKFMII